MMKLILSLALIWMLSSTGGALQCQGDQTCEGYCATAAIKGKQQKGCVSSDFCKLGNQTFSYNFGSDKLTTPVLCCNTENCNTLNVTDPGDQENNSLTCYICDADRSSVCNKTVQCQGVEDRCMSWTVTNGGDTNNVFGCVSKNLCASKVQDLRFLAGYLNFTSGPKCCGTNLCNSAWTVKLNVAPFLLGLIMFIVW